MLLSQFKEVVMLLIEENKKDNINLIKYIKNKRKNFSYKYKENIYIGVFL